MQNLLMKRKFAELLTQIAYEEQIWWIAYFAGENIYLHTEFADSPKQ